MAKYNTIFQINHLNRLSREQKADKWVKKFFNKHLLITLIYGMLARKWSLRLLENSLNPQTTLRKDRCGTIAKSYFSRFSSFTMLKVFLNPPLPRFSKTIILFNPGWFLSTGAE